MLKRFRCKRCGFHYEGIDAAPMFEHLDKRHGLAYQVYDDSQKRREMQEQWKRWWDENVEVTDTDVKAPARISIR